MPDPSAPLSPTATANSDRGEARRDAVVFAWFVPVGLEALGEHYLAVLAAHQADSRLFVGMNHGSDPFWEERFRTSGLDVEVAWAHPESGDYWDATGFLTALERFHASGESFDLVWFGHTKGGSRELGHYAEMRQELIASFWARRPEIAQAFSDPGIGLYAPRYNLTPTYPFPGPWKGWTDELASLQRVYRDERPPLGLCALDTFFVLRGDSVRRFCDAVGDAFFVADPSDYGANKWFFEMAFPSIASMQGYEPFIDHDVPGENAAANDVMLAWDVKQVHRLASEDVARWRREGADFQPRILPWNRPAWEDQRASDALAATPLEQAIPHRVVAHGWFAAPGAGTREPNPFAADHALRIVLDAPLRQAFRIRLSLTARNMEVLRLTLQSASGDAPARARSVFVDVARPGALYHELSRVALYANPVLSYFDLELEGTLGPGETLREIELSPGDAELYDVPVVAGMAIGVQQVSIDQIAAVSHVTRYIPERFPDRPAAAKRQDGKRDAVIFAWFVPDRMPELGDYYLGLLRYHHPDSKLFIGMNHGSDPIWEERLRASDLDAEVRWARPEIGDYWDTTGFLTALEAFHQSDETFDLAWFGHTKGGSRGEYSDYASTRFTLERSFWSRRAAIERIFDDPKIGIFAPRFCPLPAGAHEKDVAALQRIYRDVNSPIPLRAVDNVMIVRSEILRDFCQSLDADYFLTDPGMYGGDRRFLATALPGIAAIQGYEPFIDLDAFVRGRAQSGPVQTLRARETYRMARSIVERWRQDPFGSQLPGEWASESIQRANSNLATSLASPSRT